LNGPSAGAIDAYRELIEASDRAIADGLAGALVGMMHVHVRRLRQVAIALGHPVAAALPGAVESRLRASLRTSDRVFQIGHGEFMVLLPQLLSPGHAELAAQRLLREFEHPMQVAGRPLEAVIAIGLAWSPEHATDADGLSRRATGALESALAGGRRLDLARGIGEDSLLVDDLRTALVNNDLAVEFQPIIALADRRVAAVEALARWHCPRRGSVPPQRFVPVAEQGGLAAEFTRWTLHAGLREYAELQRVTPGIRCAINLSPRAFAEAGLVEQVVAALAIWGVPAQNVVLEVTETAVIEDPEASAQALRGLRDAGLGIAIDDFGKGYSSFTYLRHFPATALKIDQSFVSAIARDARAHRLVASMIELAHGLGIEATCEGVEDAETVGILQEMGCDYAQGYYLGRPTTREHLMVALGATTRRPDTEVQIAGAG
jgi:EAL domain-containing protein (putative c-di-GMP-specific phosphodiesterase class I)/GGDEF domain-containing protein